MPEYLTKYITKYIPSDVIKNITEFDSWTYSGGWVYWHGKPKHPSILISQQYRTLIGLIKHNMLRKAILNPKRKGA